MFNTLTYDVQLEIAALLLAHELEFLSAQGHCIQPAEDVLPFLLRRGFHPRLGARPLRDVVEKTIGDAVAANVLTGGTGSGKLVVQEDERQLQVMSR